MINGNIQQTDMNDDFDFGPPPNKDKEIAKLRQQNSDLLVLVDTLQTNLRSAESIIKKYEPECELFKTPSYKWVTSYTNNK